MEGKEKYSEEYVEVLSRPGHSISKSAVRRQSAFIKVTAVPASVPKQFNTHSHLDPCDPDNSHDGQVTTGDNHPTELQHPNNLSIKEPLNKSLK